MVSLELKQITNGKKTHHQKNRKGYGKQVKIPLNELLDTRPEKGNQAPHQKEP